MLLAVLATPPPPSPPPPPLHHPPELRAGRFIVTAAQDVRTTETAYARAMEETIVFASSRKLLALGRVFDRRLRDLQAKCVEKFDRLDIFEARSQAQVDFFGFALSMGLFGFGLVLMNMEVTPTSPLQAVTIPNLCFAMQEELPEDCPTPGGEPKYRMDISTLFAYVQGVQGVLPICMTLIGCTRRSACRRTHASRSL